ncbi:uncharacterized protein LOC110923826 [Helianthus annuus]|uniref:uncharacterized protein LOC110923826 n=1 Tax=Helianthus annuus TaxID=4232 RepID=UPI000B8F87ED|nr:uncharacterized protein LOC110923826 [Helianthus annuus]
MSSAIHPVVIVTNIKALIPITLDIENGHYTAWSKLFKIHCISYDVYDHLQPKKTTETSSSSDIDKAKDATSSSLSWERLDSIVLQWIYGTISTDLLHTILKPNTNAYAIWTALANIFQDNKATRTINLNNKFASTRLEQFPSMMAYCQALKVIYDQLTNVGSPITEEQLVLQLLMGLTEAYESTATIIQQTSPLPDFYETRSRLCMAETRKVNQVRNAAQAAGTALVATSDSHPPPNSENPDSRSGSSRYEARSDSNRDQNTRGRGHGRGRGRGRGGSAGRGRGNSTTQFTGQHGYPPWPFGFNSWAGLTTPTLGLLGLLLLHVRIPQFHSERHPPMPVS